MSTVAPPAPAPAPAEPIDRPGTLPGWLLEQARQRPRSTAIRVKNLGRWEETSWADYAERVAGIGRALLHMGVKAGDRVGIVSDNRAEWIMTDLAVQGIGAATVAVPVTASSEELAGLLSNTGADVVVVEDEEQLDKVLEAGDHLLMRHVVVIDPRGIRRLEEPASGFEALEALGSRDATRARSGDAEAWASSVSGVDPSTVATLAFTAGTTADPRAIALSHETLVAAATAGSEAFGLRANDEIVSTLPLSDIAERSLTVALALHVGAVVNFGEGGASIANDRREVRPTVVLGSPQVWERMRETNAAAVRGADPVKRGAMRVARGRGRLGGFLVRRPLRKRLGLGRARVVISTSSPCSAELVEFWRVLGVPLRQAYALTETGGFAAIASPQDPAGSVGGPVGGIECRVDGDAIALRGAVPFGVPLDGAGAAADGWLETGDLGAFDAGVLTITGRAADVISTAGHGTSPRTAEERLESSPYVRTAVVVGNGQPCLGALIVVDPTTVGDWAADRGASFTTFATLSSLPEVRELIGDAVQACNAELDERDRIGCFCVIPHDLGTDEDLVTPTHKLRRGRIATRFADQIEQMYADRGKGSAS